MSDDLAIDAKDLVKAYPGGKAGPVRAVRGVSLAVPAGTVSGLLGPNGAGKSTTVKILTTLTKATGGSAVVAGHDVDRHPDTVRRAIGCVFQKHAVDPEATGRENLLLQGHLYGLRGAALRSRTAELLGRFGVEDAAGRLVRTWSGGMQRKLDVAMGLVHRPRVLFLDEPTTGLDPEARSELWALVAGLARDEGLTVLLTTHYLEEADRLADRLVIVDRGRVVAEGTAEQLKSELRGDALVVELATEPAGLPRLDGVREVTLDGRTLRARVDDGARAVPAVLAGLEAAGLVPASVTVARPSLDDVYLRHTGRAFSAEATPELEGAGR
ncbi:MAG TPA: ATP-binding cassette domain-containing protein [Mycobacteriales bacterium]|nr:ATP-binding cassette domain-containing protein [Mycobacteriales bacterium]